MKIKDTKPMMADKEIEIIEYIIENMKPKSVLEWGSGNSTLHFSKSKHIISWLSIEHNGHYVEYLKDKTEPKVNVIWADKEWYVDSVKLIGKKYDLIIVDGEQRELCVKTAFDILNDGGLILLHDSGRQEYQEFIRMYGGFQLSEGEIPVKQGGFAHRGLVGFRR